MILIAGTRLGDDEILSRLGAGGMGDVFRARDLRLERDVALKVQILQVDVETSPVFTLGKPTVLFSGRYRMTGRDFDVSPDGTRFVMMRNDDPRTTPRLNVPLNWRRALDTRLRANRPEAGAPRVP